jgi:hypothetical protein
MVKIVILPYVVCISILGILSLCGEESFAQTSVASVSGMVRSKNDKKAMSFVSVTLRKEKDSALVMATVTNEEGRYSFSKVLSGAYLLEISSVGFESSWRKLFVGGATEFLNLNPVELAPNTASLNEVVVSGKVSEVGAKLDRKSYAMKDNLTQSGGSVLQAMQNLPGITVQEGRVQLRGSDKVTILVDGKQTAITGFGSQSGLENIPASAIERIEIINNPTAKFDANGSAGIINIIYKKTRKEGFDGKASLAAGLGSLWVRKENLPGIRPQYTMTPKINPGLKLNYRRKKVNFLFQGDYLYTETLNKNEFVTRYYDNGDTIQSQLKRNRNTHFITIKSGTDI